MMPWREALVISLGLLVGGCFLSAYQIASWTATGVSYVVSGKGVGDHALSLAMNQDCATWRILQGKEICLDYGRDFESSWDAMASTWNLSKELEVTNKNLFVSGSDEPVPNMQAYNAVTQSAKVPLADLSSVNLKETVTRDGDEAVLGIDFEDLVVPEPVATPQQDGTWQPNVLAPHSSDLDEPVQTKGRQDHFAVAPVEILPVQSLDPAIYLVIGSFRDKKNAERLSASHTDIKTTVSKVENDGRTMYRLLAGPVAKASLTGLRMELEDAGIRDSWAVKLCGRGLTAPPCQVLVQQAKLP